MICLALWTVCFFQIEFKSSSWTPMILEQALTTLLRQFFFSDSPLNQQEERESRQTFTKGMMSYIKCKVSPTFERLFELRLLMLHSTGLNIPVVTLHCAHYEGILRS